MKQVSGRAYPGERLLSHQDDNRRSGVHVRLQGAMAPNIDGIEPPFVGECAYVPPSERLIC